MIDWLIAMLSAVTLAGVHFPPASLSDDPSESMIVLAFFIFEVALLDGLLGRSIGKHLMGLRLENASGRPIGIPRAVLRMLLLSIVIPAVVMTDDKRGLHDLAAGSRVVREPVKA